MKSCSLYKSQYLAKDQSICFQGTVQTHVIMMAPAVGFVKTIYYNVSDLQTHTCNDYDTGRSAVMVTLDLSRE